MNSSLVPGVDLPRSERAEQKYDDDSGDFHSRLYSFVVLDACRQKASLFPSPYPALSDKDLEQCTSGRNTREAAPSGAQDGRLVEIGGLTVLASTLIPSMGCFLTYCHAFLESEGNGPRVESGRISRGKVTSAAGHVRAVDTPGP